MFKFVLSTVFLVGLTACEEPAAQKTQTKSSADDAILPSEPKPKIYTPASDGTMPPEYFADRENELLGETVKEKKLSEALKLGVKLFGNGANIKGLITRTVVKINGKFVNTQGPNAGGESPTHFYGLSDLGASHTLAKTLGEDYVQYYKDDLSEIERRVKDFANIIEGSNCPFKNDDLSSLDKATNRDEALALISCLGTITTSKPFFGTE
jgi:hypothetical protein